MEEICFAKFSQNKELKKKLIETSPLLLEEENAWSDKTWGTVDGEGNNYLGKILMKIRDEMEKTK